MSTLPPRVVVVARPSELTELAQRHGTLQQARFALARGAAGPDPLAELSHRHTLLASALHAVEVAIPEAWRRARVLRAELPRFLFEPEDLVVVVGQDGLVANVSKYLQGQPALGINPAREIYDGILVRHLPREAPDVYATFAAGTLRAEARTMVQAESSDGQRLLALNEIFIGHRTHQSARYRIACMRAQASAPADDPAATPAALAPSAERHSSSGVIVTTGTGATGWAKSIARARLGAAPLPAPLAPELAFFVREAWPSVATGTALTDGVLAPGDVLTLTSEMNDGGTAFGDGIEDDRLDLPYGQRLTISRAPTTLQLV